MSSKKRRAARKITILLRMDRQWFTKARTRFAYPEGAPLYWAMKALAGRLIDMGLKRRAMAAMVRSRTARGQNVE